MRRKDREITNIDEIEKIINQAKVCRIGLSLNDQPYVFPICFGYADNVLYLHSAKQGKKIDIIKQNNKVCFEIDIDQQPVINLDNPTNSDMLYKSVIGFGKAYFVEDKAEKIKALEYIIKHYAGDKPHGDYKKSLDFVQVIKIAIDNMTGKSNPGKKVANG
jgi:uncharacterized protein